MAAPNFETLKLRLPDDHAHVDPFDDCTTLNDVCRSIARIVILNITPGTSAYASRLCTFEHPDIFLLHSPSAAHATLDFLNTVARPTRLSIRTRGVETNADGALLTVEDASGKLSLWVPGRLMTAAWPSYAPDHFPPRLSVHVDLLSLVASNVAAGVSALSVWTPSDAQLPPGDIPPFPALESLELRHTGAPWPCINERMFAQLVTMLLRSAERKLRMLTFENFPEHVESEAFSSFADSVRVKVEPRRHGA